MTLHVLFYGENHGQISILHYYKNPTIKKNYKKKITMTYMSDDTVKVQNRPM